MAVKKINKDSFEYSYNRLEDILDKMENDAENIPLEDMLKLYKESLELLKICKDKLIDAELSIQKINLESNSK